MEIYKFNKLEQPQIKKVQNNINLLKDIKTRIDINLDKVEYPLTDILTLRPGSLIEINKDEAEFDLEISGNMIGKGELVVADNKLYIRVKKIGQKK